MKKIRTSIAILMVCGMAYAQSGGEFMMNKSTIANGGGQSSSGDFVLSGSIGQLDASSGLAGGAFSLAGGFWSITVNSDIIYKNGFEQF